MICKVVIYDFVLSRRIIHLLDDDDFELQRQRWHSGDPVLTSLQHYPLFAGRTRWCDLNVTHLHIMLVNMLRFHAELPEKDRSNRKNPVVARLIFFLCGLIHLLQDRSESLIELLRVKRMTGDDVVYDYSATLNVTVSPPIHRGLKVVVDNP